MDLVESFRNQETALLSALRGHQAAFDDPNGKGASAEREIERALIRPYLPPDFDCGKGTVIERGGAQSAAIDRVLYSRGYCPPLVYSADHSVFPVECVAGVVEVTMRLDATKLKHDIEQTKTARALRKGSWVVPLPETETVSEIQERDTPIGCRAYIVGVPASEGWQPQTIADAFLRLQSEIETLVHGLYVIGIGFFHTVGLEQHDTPKVQAYLGYERLFRFTSTLRIDLDRWPRLRGASPYLGNYVSGLPKPMQVPKD